MITSLARQNSNENFSSGIQSLKTVPKQPPSNGSAGRFFFEDECPSDCIIKKTAQVTVDYACNAGDPGSIPMLAPQSLPTAHSSQSAAWERQEPTALNSQPECPRGYRTPARGQGD